MDESLIRIEGEFNLFAKTPEVAAEWRSTRIDDRIRTYVRLLTALLAHHGKLCVLTDLLREDPGSVHHYGRGADCRITCSMEEAEKIRLWFNVAFPYDPSRPWLQTIPALRHGSAPHFHLQIRAGKELL